MKLKKYHIITFTIFILYGLNYTIFERRFFFNEILALIGLMLFLKNALSSRFTLKIPKSAIWKILLVFWGICLIHLLTSVLFKTNWYYYLRNSVIFYASFVFFVGFYWSEYFKIFLQEIIYWLKAIIFIPLFLRLHSLLDRFAISAFFPLFFRRFSFSTTITLLLLNFLYAFLFSSMTAAMVGVFLFVILVIRHYTLIRLALIVMIIGFWSLIAFFSPSLQLYREDSKSTNLFGNVDKVLQDNILLRIDGNSTWRLILWYRLTVDEFPRNVWGLGFGTPLIPYKEGADTADSDYNDEHDAHVIGVHNTYVTLLARLGLLYVFVLYGIYTIVFKEFYRFRAYYIAHQDYNFFVAFFTISIIGLFNLVLESPIYSGLYWFFLGAVAKSIFNRQFTNENPANS